MLNPFTHSKVLKSGLPGRATIVGMSMPQGQATVFNLPMTLLVSVEGMAPYEVEDQWWVKDRDVEELKGSLPVRVDREDPATVAIDWETLRSERGVLGVRDAIKFMRSGQDEQPAPAADPAVMAAQVQQAMDMANAFAAQAPAAGGDDVVSKLERLAALRDSGALTEAEFEQQKRRVLGT